MAVKTLKYVYRSSQVRYKDNWGVDLDNIKVKKSIHCSGNSLDRKLSKMAANMAAKQIYVYLSS